MTKKQIEKKAKEIKAKIEDVANDYALDYDGREFDIAYDAFWDGADWALSHQWVSVEDKLPPASITVLVKTKYNSYFAAQYSEKFEDFLCGAVGIANVTHWMPIPPLAEEGNKK